MQIKLSDAGFWYKPEVPVLAEEFPTVVITMWAAGGFTIGMIVGVALMIAVSKARTRREK